MLDTKAKLRHASKSKSVAEAIGDVCSPIVVREGVLEGAPRVMVLPAVQCPLTQEADVLRERAREREKRERERDERERERREGERVVHY
jgi:hypothetical protein